MPRRRIAAALAVYSVVVASGAPLPTAGLIAWIVPTVESTERFPCEACPCGCGTAARCWGACCCHTPAQRLAWARREGVRPPEAALDAAERAGLDTRPWRAAPRFVAKQTAAPMPDALPPCCQKRQGCQTAEAGATKPARRPNRPGVSVLSAMACHGLTDAWLSLGEAPIAPPLNPVGDEPTRYAVEPAPGLTAGLSERPEPPPPRRGIDPVA